MNKNEFIAAVYEHASHSTDGLSKSVVGQIIESALATIENAMRQGDEVRLVGFGNFYVSQRDAGTGRNPRTGEPIAIKASRSPKFRAGKQLRDSVNTPPTKKSK